MGIEQRHLYLCPGARYRTFDPHVHVYPDQPSRLVGMRGDLNERALHVQISAVSRESNRVRLTRQEFDQR